MVLDEALKTTNRRVNALEFIQIPKIIATIAWIESELDEESREDFFRLKKVQDNKKRDKKKQAAEKAKKDEEKAKEGATDKDGQKIETTKKEDEQLIPDVVEEMGSDAEEDSEMFV